MLYWWTRKPLVVGRAVALTSTLKDIEAIKYLLGLSIDKRAFNHTSDIFIYEEKLGKNPFNIKVLDPFGGAGNLIYEAKKLGLNCYAQDYNPIAYLIMKAILVYPSKYGAKLADDVQKYGKDLIERTRKELGKFFIRNGKKSLAYLWVWCIKCPYCEQRIPLTNHMWLAKTERKSLGVRFNPTDDHDFKVELIKDMHDREGKEFTQKDGKAICIKCRNSIDYEYLTKDIAKNHDREMIAIVTQDIGRKNYESATEEDRRMYIEAKDYLKQNWNAYEERGMIPHEQIRPRSSKESPLWHFGLKKWDQFFGDRQLLVMLTLLKNIKQICNEIFDREYS